MKPSRSGGLRANCRPLAPPSQRGALQPAEVVGGALALAAARPRDDRAVAGADELLELGLGLA